MFLFVTESRSCLSEILGVGRIPSAVQSRDYPSLRRRCHKTLLSVHGTQYLCRSGDSMDLPAGPQVPAVETMLSTKHKLLNYTINNNNNNNNYYYY